MYKARVTTALLNASLLINKVLKGVCTFQEFVNEYGNFFYYEALDGHEAKLRSRFIGPKRADSSRCHDRGAIMANAPRLPQQAHPVLES
jgi:hypothetical protein